MQGDGGELFYYFLRKLCISHKNSLRTVPFEGVGGGGGEF